MNLDSSIRLEAVLAAGVSANQPEVHVDYVPWNVDGTQGKPATFRVALNSASDVTILAAPTLQGVVYEVTAVNIYNKDTASVTCTVKTDDGTTERIYVKQVVTTLQTLAWERDVGWYKF